MQSLARIALLFVVLFGGCTPSAPVGSDAGAEATVSQPSQPPTPVENPFRDLRPDPNWKPTANPSWYGQPAYRDPKKLGLGIPLQPPPVYQASWDTPAWFVDPQNISTTASDTNNCTTAITACRTYAQIAARWGTYAPRLRQLTTITFLSSHTDNTDPVIARPFFENVGSLTIQAVLPTPAQTGVLAGTVQRNRATPQLLKATLGAGGAAGQMIVNVTHSSRAFLFQNPAGNTWSFTQPLTPGVIPYAPFGAQPAEVNTWVDGDTFNVYNLINVNIVDVEPTVEDISQVVFYQAVQLYQLNVWASSLFGNVTVNSGVFGTEIGMSRGLNIVSSGIFTFGSNTFINVFQTATGGAASNYGSVFSNNTSMSLKFYGGALRGGTLNSIGLDYDAIVYGALTNINYAQLGAVYFDTSVQVQFNGPVDAKTTGKIGANFVWGFGGIIVAGSSRFLYPAGAGGFAATFPSTVFTFEINQSTTACGHSAAATDVVNCGLPINATTMDTAQDATHFGGNAFNPGGGCITNQGM